MYGLLNQYGLTAYQKQVADDMPPDQTGRITSEDKGRYKVATESGIKTGMVLGKFRHEATDKNDFPKVGDWVLFRLVPGDSDNIVIEKILPRVTELSRQEIWPKEHKQILATNIETVAIVITPPVASKLGQVERFISLIKQGGSTPTIVINKIDTAEDFKDQIAKVKDYFSDIVVHATNAETGQGVAELKASLTRESTTVIVGLSGVGKSSLINRLVNEQLQATGSVRQKDSAGKHTTTRRDMIVSSDGLILIDTPGIRELGFTDDAGSQGFEDIEELALQCKFTNCDHDKSDGCAVKAAVASGELDEKRYRHYLKITT